MNIQSPPPSNLLRRLAEYIFGGFGSLLIVAGILCVIAWRPLGGDSPQPDYLALGVILFIVAGVQACFNAWQVFQRSIQLIVGLEYESSDCIALRFTTI